MFICFSFLESFSETDLAVLIVEDGVELLHETITKDPERTDRGSDIHAHESRDACTTFVHDVFLRSENEGFAVKDELEVGKSAVVRAVEPRALGTADDAAKLAVDHVDLVSRASDHRGTRVDDSLAALLTADVVVHEVDSVHLDLPVVPEGKRNVREFTLEESLIITTEGELTAHHARGVTSKPEGEHLPVNKTLLHELVPHRSSVTDRDSIKGKTKDTVELAESESHAGLLLDFSKVNTLNSKISKTDDIIADVTADVAAAVHDLKLGAIGLVSAALRGIVTAVELAGELSALAGRNPEVARASIEDNLELLRRSTDGDGAIELSLGVITQGNIVVVTKLGVEAKVSALLDAGSTLSGTGVLDIDGDVNNSRSKSNDCAESKNKTHS